MALLASTGLFAKHPKPDLMLSRKAEQLRAWSYDCERVDALWKHTMEASDVPLRLFRWAVKDPGKMKVATSQVPAAQTPPPPAFAQIMAGLAGRFRA